MVVRLAGGWWVRQAGCWRGERPRCRPFGARRSPETALSALFPPLVWGCGSGGWFTAAVVVNEDDLLAGQGFQLGDELLGVGFGVDAAGVEVVAEVGVGLPGRQHVPDDLDEGVGDGERGLLARPGVGSAAEAAVQPVVAGADPGPGAGGGQGGLDEDRAEVGVALAAATRAAFAGRFVVAGGQPGPGGQVLGGGEPGHVHADLGDDYARDPFADTRDGH